MVIVNLAKHPSPSESSNGSNLKPIDSSDSSRKSCQISNSSSNSSDLTHIDSSDSSRNYVKYRTLNSSNSSDLTHIDSNDSSS